MKSISALASSLRSGVDDKFTINPGNPYFRNDFFNGNIGNGQCSRGCKAGQASGMIFRIRRNKGDDHLHFT